MDAVQQGGAAPEAEPEMARCAKAHCAHFPAEHRTGRGGVEPVEVHDATDNDIVHKGLRFAMNQINKVIGREYFVLVRPPGGGVEGHARGGARGVRPDGDESHMRP